MHNSTGVGPSVSTGSGRQWQQGQYPCHRNNNNRILQRCWFLIAMIVGNDAMTVSAAWTSSSRGSSHSFVKQPTATRGRYHHEGHHGLWPQKQRRILNRNVLFAATPKGRRLDNTEETEKDNIELLDTEIRGKRNSTNIRTLDHRDDDNNDDDVSIRQTPSRNTKNNIANKNRRQDFFEFENGPDAFLDEGDLALLNDISLSGESSFSLSSSSSSSSKKENDLESINVTTGRTTRTSSSSPSKTKSKKSNNPTKATTTGSSVVTPSVLSLQDMKHLSSDLSYFYLRNELGLSEEAMWKITNEAGSALGMTAYTIQTKVNVLRTTMNLSNEELCHIITSQPTVLHLSAKKNLSPKLLYLLRQLDLGRDDLKTLILGWPGILAYSMDNLKKKLHFFKATMGYTIHDCRILLCKEPKLLTAGVDTGLLPRWKFLIREMEFPIEDVRKLCLVYPQILLKSLDYNLRPKLIFFFILTLSMTPQEVRKMILSYPPILDYTLEDHIRPISTYLLSLDFSSHEIARMLLKFPRLLTHSLVKIKHVVGYLRFQLGLDAVHVRRIIYQAPQVVGLTTANLQSKVDFLESISTTISSSSSSRNGSDDDVTSSNSDSSGLRHVIVGMPTLLLLSVEKNLRPKVEYLKERLGPEEFSRSVHRLPTLLGYSLDKRIRPRLETILEAGVDGSSLTVGIPMKHDAFEAWLQGRTRKAEQRRRSGALVHLVPNSSKNEQQEQSLINDEASEQVTPTNQIVEKGGRIVHWTRRENPT